MVKTVLKKFLYSVLLSYGVFLIIFCDSCIGDPIYKFAEPLPIGVLTTGKNENVEEQSTVSVLELRPTTLRPDLVEKTDIQSVWHLSPQQRLIFTNHNRVYCPQGFTLASDATCRKIAE